jgi:exodeoxyribonuclease VII small subunit
MRGKNETGWPVQGAWIVPAAHCRRGSCVVVRAGNRQAQIHLPCRRIGLKRLKSNPQTQKTIGFMTHDSAPELDAPASYESALQELEQLVARLESGDLPLQQLLSQYQRGAQLLKYCRDRLEEVEAQIKVLDHGVLKAWSSS